LSVPQLPLVFSSSLYVMHRISALYNHDDSKGLRLVQEGNNQTYWLLQNFFCIETDT